MKANVTNIRTSGAIARHRKENGFYRQISILDRNDGFEIVTARLYWPGRDGASPCYACIWFNSNDLYGSGAGKAGGYGYHKASAAIGAAISDAGIYLNEDIAGRGDAAIYDAFDAIARALTGQRKFFRVLAHA